MKRTTFFLFALAAVALCKTDDMVLNIMTSKT